MAALKIKLIASINGRSKDHLGTITGLGLKRFGEERLLQDTPSIRGMVAKVAHMVSMEPVAGEAPKRKRTKRPVAQANK
jgi:large subunit ribosomal protein L30